MMLFNNTKKAIIEETIYLAKDYNKEHNYVFSDTEKVINFKDKFEIYSGRNEKGARLFQKKRALFCYLNDLSYDDLKIVQTIMYVGRGGYQYEQKNNDLYQVVFESLTWSDDKSIEVNQIVGKSIQLAEYLKNGMMLVS